MSTKPINDLSHELIGAAIEVHRELGPGLLGSAYEGAYSHELTLRQIQHVRQKLIPIYSAQLMTYLRLGNYPLGLLMNFNVLRLVDGIERVSNNAPNLSAPSASSAFQHPHQ